MPDRGGHVIVLAEDDPDIRDLFTLALERGGGKVVGVGNGNDVLSTCQAVDPGLLILDLTLPGTGGLEVCRQVRADRALDGMKILLVTGFGRENGIDEGMAAGADSYLMKPFRPTELAQRVDELLGTSPDGDL